VIINPYIQLQYYQAYFDHGFYCNLVLGYTIPTLAARAQASTAIMSRARAQAAVAPRPGPQNSARGGSKN